MDVREKLVELKRVLRECLHFNYDEFSCDMSLDVDLTAENLIAHGVMVQEHGYWETVVEVMDNTVCGNGVKFEYKRCSCCKNPAKFSKDDFCGSCGAKLDLQQPPKGE